MAIERSRDQDLRRTEEEQYRTIFDLLPVAVWEEDISGIQSMIETVRKRGVADFSGWLEQNPAFIKDALRTLRVISVNRAALALHGASDQAELVASLRQFFETPTGLPLVRNILVAIFEGQKQLEVLSTIINKAGRKLHVLQRFNLPKNLPGRLLLCETDVTDRYRAVELFETVAGISSDVIWERDVEADETWNSGGISDRLGHGDDGIRHDRQYWIDHLHPDDRDITVAMSDAAIMGDDSDVVLEYRYRRGDGTYSHVRERAAYIRDENGKVIRMIGNLVDISEQKDAAGAVAPVPAAGGGGAPDRGHRA